ncbi:Alpha/Beta hydrolase protein [Trichoderma velutinum]
MRPGSLVASLSVLSLSAAAPSVQLLNGTLTGSKCAYSEANFYLAIPYATPPIGELRFAPPKIFNAKFGGDGKLNATVSAASCPQFGSPAFAESGAQSEDCLTLDVYVPFRTSNKSQLPVKVWLYGGFNEAGGISDATYNGCFSAKDSIVVTVNYRVGPLGFLSVKEAGLMGNYGLQDQLLALKWVQSNIHAFGGDPKKVLLFGQSAGALDTYALGTIRGIESIISAAAIQSGGSRTLPTIDEAQNFTTKFVEKLNCTVCNAQCIRQVQLPELSKAFSSLVSSRPNVPSVNTNLQNNGFGYGWGPLVDGTFIEEQPAKIGMRVPSIIGNNANDGALFVLAQYGAGLVNITEPQYQEFLQYSFGWLAANVSASYPLSKYNSSTVPPAFYAMSEIITDYGYKCPTYRALKATEARGVDVWAYNFNHTPTCSWYQAIPKDPEILQLLGPTHTAEIPYIFSLISHLPLSGTPDSTISNGNCSFDNAEVAISQFMEQAWTTLARDKRPAHEHVWPRWNGQSHRGVEIKNLIETSEMDYSNCAFWDDISSEL